MSCPTHETLIGFAAGDLDAPERQSVATHLETDCPSCSAELSVISSLRSIATSGVLESPPLGALERAVRIPSDRTGRSFATELGRVASLVFDTLASPLPRGARAAATTSRQMLFRALDYDIDVRVSQVDSAFVRVSGQVLPGSERPIESVSGVDVALIHDGQAVAICPTSGLGEFDFGTVNPGNYEMSIETDEDRILIEQLSTFAR